eukprot:TRINITY_DN24217_c0_g1_i2.p1 TRINITY_DN24217_c0_g1~~TRINITY_DN24217_c0_g1_i2.p1  ORF type:complete len:294 (+),score=67.09 TRINITY_DN24217_c0_g1_i2:32-913(+)
MDIPIDVIRRVLAYLDTATIDRLARVSKKWFTASRDPRFWVTVSLRGKVVNKDEEILGGFDRYYGRDRLRMAKVLELKPTRSHKQLNNLLLTATTAYCPNLVELRLTGCLDVTEEALTSFLSTTPHLEVLKAGSCWTSADLKMTHLTSTALLKAAPCLSHLAKVDISGWGVTDVGLMTLAKECRALTALSVEGCLLLTPKAFAPLCALPHLRFLDVSRVFLTRDHWLALFPPPPLETLLAAHCTLHKPTVRTMLSRGIAVHVPHSASTAVIKHSLLFTCPAAAERALDEWFQY